MSHLILGGGYTTTREQAAQHRLDAVEIAVALDADCSIINTGRLNGLDRKAALDASEPTITWILEERRAPVRPALEPVVAWQSGFLTRRARLWIWQIWSIIWILAPTRTLTTSGWPGAAPKTWSAPGAGCSGSSSTTADPASASGGSRPKGIPSVEMVRAVESTGYTDPYDVEYTYPVDLVDSDPASYAPEVVLECAPRG